MVRYQKIKKIIMASLHHGEVDTYYEELVLALKPSASQYCETTSNEFSGFANLALFSVMFSFILFGLCKYCHYQFSK